MCSAVTRVSHSPKTHPLSLAQSSHNLKKVFLFLNLTKTIEQNHYRKIYK